MLSALDLVQVENPQLFSPIIAPLIQGASGLTLQMSEHVLLIFRQLLQVKNQSQRKADQPLQVDVFEDIAKIRCCSFLRRRGQ